MLSILGLLCALALASQNLTQVAAPSTIQTKSKNGEILIDLNCGPFDSANCTSARLLLLIRISLERVCNYIASDLKIKVPIKIQVNFAEITDPNTDVLAEEGRPISKRLLI